MIRAIAKSSLLLGAVASGTFAVRSASGQATAAIVMKRVPGVDSLVAAEFAKDSIGSITVGLIAGSKLVWTRSYGFADMKAHRLANRSTVYRIGSITKPFTAVMLMQQVAAGKIRLSDPVARFLPEVEQIRSKPSGAAPFTFLQLATMTAGLAREPREEGPFWTGPVSAWDRTLLAALPHTDYISFPGTEFSYSNIGYAILGAALSRVTGQPYTEYERERIFKPLAMDHTRFEIDPGIAADLAVGYDVNRIGTVDDHAAAQEGREGRGYKVPNGAIFTTVDDLSRFVEFELGHGPPNVLPGGTLDDAFGGFVAADPSLEKGYGLGFMAMRRDTLTYLGHSGSVAGYQAAMYFHRAYQVGVVLLRNVTGGKEDPDGLAVDILSSLVNAKRAYIQAGNDGRFKEQKAATGSEAALRRVIEELRIGRPDYDLMGSDLARATRRALPQEQSAIAKLGALQSLTFTGVGPAGPDIYRVKFENGTLEWRIWLNPDGYVDYVSSRPISP